MSAEDPRALRPPGPTAAPTGPESAGIAAPPEPGSREARLLLDLLDAGVRDARIAVVMAGGRRLIGGGGPLAAGDGAHIVLHVHSLRFFRRVLAYGSLGLGEAYMAREFDVRDGALEDLLTVLLRNRLDRRVRGDWRLALRIGLVRLVNAVRPGRWNVERHYDLGDDLFETFLDSTLTYSCGYAATPNDSLEQLQRNKLKRICGKLGLRPGDRLLDVGCGYGGLLIHAARAHGVRGWGLSNSRRHVARAARAVAEAGLSDRVTVRYGDYSVLRAEREQFDKIVSVGMMEHLPRREYRPFVHALAGLLTPRGVGLLHTIGCSDSANAHDPFIQRHVFPGSRTPTLSEIAAELERNDLLILDVENIVRHYVPTLRRWLERFRANRHALDPRRYGVTFLRMWEYYLCCGIAAAAVSAAAVYQVLFSRDPAASPPFRRV
jgi:cyclopropane-fatty-acyl-phospholipid synthase